MNPTNPGNVAPKVPPIGTQVPNPQVATAMLKTGIPISNFSTLVPNNYTSTGTFRRCLILQ